MTESIGTFGADAAGLAGIGTCGAVAAGLAGIDTPDFGTHLLGIDTCGAVAAGLAGIDTPDFGTHLLGIDTCGAVAAGLAGIDTPDFGTHLLGIDTCGADAASLAGIDTCGAVAAGLAGIDTPDFGTHLLGIDTCGAVAAGLASLVGTPDFEAHLLGIDTFGADHTAGLAGIGTFGADAAGLASLVGTPDFGAHLLGIDTFGADRAAGLGGPSRHLRLRSTSARSDCRENTAGLEVAGRAITPPHDYEFEDISLSHLPFRVAEIDAFLVRTLGEIKPAFAVQFRGSLLRSDERGPDWWTQAAASLRKLFLGVLHTAAPDDFVLPWVTNRKQQVDRRGHPTRRTKIDWLCQSIPNEAYRKFVQTELDSALPLIDLLNSANHVDEFPEFEKSFSWTYLRMKVAICHIVTILRRIATDHRDGDTGGRRRLRSDTPDFH